MAKNVDNIIRNPNPKPIKKSAPLSASSKPPRRNFKINLFRTFRHNKYKAKLLILVLVVSITALTSLIIYIKPALYLYSFKKDGRYLILLQNNAELRGGGGFLGSFAVVEIATNSVKKYYFESNIYKKDN